MEIKLFSLYNLLVTQRMIFLGKVFATNFAPVLENTLNAGEGCAKQM